MTNEQPNLPAFPPEYLYSPSMAEASRIQRELAARVETADRLDGLSLVAGADVSNNPYDPFKMVYAAMVLLEVPSFQPAQESCVGVRSDFPYVSGYLGFREAPVLVEAFRRLERKPDLILVDGHGISHPRGLGIASHIGVLLDVPTIGVAKSILVGSPAAEPGLRRGDRVPLVWKDRTLGMVLRTRDNVRPVYVSVGHRVSLDTAVEIVMQCLGRYRLPEPTRLAHASANACRKRLMQMGLQSQAIH